MARNARLGRVVVVAALAKGRLGSVVAVAALARGRLGRVVVVTALGNDGLGGLVVAGAGIIRLGRGVGARGLLNDYRAIVLRQCWRGPTTGAGRARARRGAA